MLALPQEPPKHALPLSSAGNCMQCIHLYFPILGTECVFVWLEAQIDLHGMHVDEALATLESTLANFSSMSHPGNILLQVLPQSLYGRLACWLHT